ncbi:hypothetical protein PR048_009537 [Dryococelus australis]|uniref:Uncharacterized protein n=1 Tax=Dryococelus australis TaxID=614101 RepID=A0ABQ9I0Y0_9NEOP|nr:hypothetical protein PR048_009537 [Dryococelus australis]
MQMRLPFSLTEKAANLALLITGNASGSLFPPLVCFKYEQLPQDIVAFMPAQWDTGKSPNRWTFITSDIAHQ